MGYTTNTNTAWYDSLKQPPGNPPKWAFGPVWSILYGMMGYASHLMVEVYDKNLHPIADQAGEALGQYYVQLGLNLAWMPLFFTAKQPTLALANIGVLTGMVWNMTSKVAAFPTSVDTSLLLAPYCAWLGYATYLNAGIVYQNWNRPQVSDRVDLRS